MKNLIILSLSIITIVIYSVSMIIKYKRENIEDEEDMKNYRKAKKDMGL